MDVPTSTTDDCESWRQGREAVWSRRVLLTGMTAVIAAAAVGWLGNKDGTVSASGGGYDLELLYARTARAGLDVPWQATVRHPGGFPGDTVTLGVTAAYFDIFETQGFHPAIADATRDARMVYLSFTKPPGDTLVVSYDAYIQPISQIGRSGTLAVVVDQRPVVSIDFTTTLMP